MTQEPLFYARFLAKRLLEIALSWQRLRSQVIKKYLKRVCYMLTLLKPNYFRPTLYTKGGGGGHLDSLLSHQHLVVQTSNFARY